MQFPAIFDDNTALGQVFDLVNAQSASEASPPIRHAPGFDGYLPDAEGDNPTKHPSIRLIQQTPNSMASNATFLSRQRSYCKCVLHLQSRDVARRALGFC